MLYGDEKLREMARSILPSTFRGAKKSASRTRRQHRRNCKQIVRKAMLDEDFLDELDEQDKKESIKLRYERRERQGADKLNHFERWAIRVTDGLDPNARMAKMRAILPDNLVGWHARTHLDFLPEFITNRHGYGGFRVDVEGTFPRPHPFEHRYRKGKRDLAAELTKAILDNPSVPRLLQDWLNQKHVTCKWTLAYGEPLKERKEVWNPRRRSQYGGFMVDAYWRVTVSCTPVILREDVRGPRSAPHVPTRAVDVPEFLDALEEASSALKTVKSEGWVEQLSSTFTESSRDFGGGAKVKNPGDFDPASLCKWVGVGGGPRADRPNPHRHPEWQEALIEFLDHLNEGGDLRTFAVERGIAVR